MISIDFRYQSTLISGLNRLVSMISIELAVSVSRVGIKSVGFFDCYLSKACFSCCLDGKTDDGDASSSTKAPR